MQRKDFKTGSGIFSSLFQGFFKDCRSTIERQQKIIFILYSSVLVAGLAANLFGFSGPQVFKAVLLNSVFSGITLLLLLLYRLKILSMRYTFSVMVLVVQLFTCSEMIFCALEQTEYRLMLIIGNMLLLAVNVMFVLMFYLKNISCILCGSATATYIVCMYITDNGSLKNFCLLYLLLFLCIAILGELLARNIHRLDKENRSLKKDEKDLLNVLKIERDQVKGYVGLAGKRNTPAESRLLLESLKDEMQQNLITNVKEALTDREMEMVSMSDVFPELTPSEIEICRFIIHGKTLKEICAILKKSESNITCQRTHIRRKLKLQPSDSLKQVLQARFDERKGG